MVISPLIRVRCIVTPLITPLIRIALRTFLQDQAAEKCARTYPGALEPSAEAQGLWFRGSGSLTRIEKGLRTGCGSGRVSICFGRQALLRRQKRAESEAFSFSLCSIFAMESSLFRDGRHQSRKGMSPVGIIGHDSGHRSGSNRSFLQS